ncbi:MAG: DUF2459 domain-containing protein [Bacteroidales bacterium]
MNYKKFCTVSFGIVVFLITFINVHARQYTVYVVQEYWHTGIIIETEDVPVELWPEIERFGHNKRIDVGWGDRDFYQATGQPVGLAAKAIFWPTTSVIRLDGFNVPLKNYYGSDARMKEITMDEEKFHQLITFISKSFQRDENEEIIPGDKEGESNTFFLGKRKYHLFRTCNTWVALAFKSAGYDIRHFFVLAAWQLFRQLEKID